MQCGIAPAFVCRHVPHVRTYITVCHIKRCVSSCLWLGNPAALDTSVQQTPRNKKTSRKSTNKGRVEKENKEGKQQSLHAPTSATFSATNPGATSAAYEGIYHTRTGDCRINSMVRTASTAGSMNAATTRPAVPLFG